MPAFLYVLLLPALVGAGSESKFSVVEGWPKIPAGWSFTMVSNISGDSRGRIDVCQPRDHPITIFEPDGKFVGTMGENDIPPTMNYDLTVSPRKPISVKRWVHGIHVDPSDNVWVTDLARHIVLKFSPQGKLLLTLGTPGQSGESPKHFFQPSSVAVGATGDVFVADGYGQFSHREVLGGWKVRAGVGQEGERARRVRHSSLCGARLARPGLTSPSG